MAFPGDPAPPPDSASARTYQRLEPRTRAAVRGLVRSALVNADAHIERGDPRQLADTFLFPSNQRTPELPVQMRSSHAT